MIRIPYRKIITLNSSKLFNSLFSFKFADQKQKIPLEKMLQDLAENTPVNSGNEDLSPFVNNYIALEQSSFYSFSKQQKSDPQLMLMLLSSFQDPAQIKQAIVDLYPHIDFFQKGEMLILLQKVLAFKPQKKPKVPFPKPLQQIESVLVILNEIYPADLLVEWIKYIPTYTGSEWYILLMGYFSILQKMSQQVKSRNQNLLVKCHQRIINALTDQKMNIDIKVGIIALAFQQNYGHSILLLVSTPIDFDNVDPYVTAVLFTNVNKYLKLYYDQSSRTNQYSDEIKSALKQQIKVMMNSMLSVDFLKFIKIQMLIDFWEIIKLQKQLKGTYLSLANKLIGLLGQKQYMKTMKSLKVQEIVQIFQAIEKHKLNSEKALTNILVLLSPHLKTMQKQYFLRVLKCLVTYVRQCEDYLISTRQILQQRKWQFNQQQATKINTILRRVQVLFPRKFQLK